jgi:hypothetical protein
MPGGARLKLHRHRTDTQLLQLHKSPPMLAWCVGSRSSTMTGKARSSARECRYRTGFRNRYRRSPRFWRLSLVGVSDQECILMEVARRLRGNPWLREAVGLTVACRMVVRSEEFGLLRYPREDWRPGGLCMAVIWKRTLFLLERDGWGSVESCQKGSISSRLQSPLIQSVQPK